jgi:RimJ/RimL family protein N-acetyltransferase
MSTIDCVAVHVRRAVEKDVGEMTMVHAVVRRVYYVDGGVSMPSDVRGVSDEYLEFWSDVLAADGTRAWIAEANGEFVGFLVAGAPVHEDLKNEPVLELIGLYLLPKVWGSGIAQSLHDRFLDVLLDAPTAQEGALDVWSGNQRAQAFYQRRGWIPDGRSRPGPGEQPFIGLRLPLSRRVGQAT